MIINSKNFIIRNLENYEIEEARMLHNDPQTLNWLTDNHVVEEQEQLEWFNHLQGSKNSKRLSCRLMNGNNFIGVFRLDRMDLPNGTVEVGLDIKPDERRKGYAYEIYNSVLAHLFTNMNFYRVSLATLETNVAAINLYLKLGYKLEGTLRSAILRDNKRLNVLKFGLLHYEFQPR
jgi:RimJ/RimL family protein N-acetyltransferase